MPAPGDRKAELVALLEAHGALAEPELLVDLAADPAGPVRVQALLSGLHEVPFHFTRDLWHRLESEAREKPVLLPAAPAPRPRDPEAERARKEALRRAAEAIYDRATPREGDADHAGADGDSGAGDDEDAGSGAFTVEAHDAATEARTWRVAPRGDWRPLAAEHAGRLEVMADMTGNSTCEGTTSDFVTYFQDRYRQIGKMLRARRELRNAVPIERVKAGQQEVQVIGMVLEVATTKNGNRLIELEDETGSIRALVRSDETQLMALADTLVQDEVVGAIGQSSGKGDMLFLQGLIRPDIPIHDASRKRGADVPLMAAFLSDVHVGSHTFLQDNWKRMLRWLSGHGSSKRERDAAGRVKYLVIPGDLVDGVGVYPGQQNELSIPDIYDQYGAFGDWLASVPNHVEVVIQPGNHDAARPAEPQPGFAKEVRERFEHHAARFVANPATFRMHGVTTLGYHGTSLIDFATSVASLDISKPLATMEQMLKSRHLAPIYGERTRTPIAPEHHDYLVISDVPDLFVTGHVHVPGLGSYRGVQMVNCGTWQSQTSYQKMLNFTPDPARMPLFDLQTLRGTLVDFQSPETVGEMG